MSVKIFFIGRIIIWIPAKCIGDFCVANKKGINCIFRRNKFQLNPRKCFKNLYKVWFIFAEHWHLLKLPRWMGFVFFYWFLKELREVEK